MTALATPEILTLLSILLGGGFIAAVVGVYKARPERDSVIVSSAANAAEILQGLNSSLHEELKRLKEQLAACETGRAQDRDRIRELERLGDLEDVLRRRRPPVDK